LNCLFLGEEGCVATAVLLESEEGTLRSSRATAFCPVNE